MIDYTLVVGVDAHHLEQLAWTWPTWIRHKPSILQHPMVVFFDRAQISPNMVLSVVDPHPNLRLVMWPNHNQTYEGGDDKWTDPQRYRMLAGFIHVPAVHIHTPYWLKIDTDTVATGIDSWIDEDWFKDDPAIVAQGWGFTKPPDQMLKLDAWVDGNSEVLNDLWNEPALEMVPNGIDDKLRHKRIISWCGFFRTEFTKKASVWAERTSGPGKLPVPSQDGFLWYVATRLGLPVKRVDMKSKGWEHWSTMHNVVLASKRSLKETM